MNIFMLPNLQALVEEILRPCVEKGAAWLDEYEPGWVQKIIPDTLDLSSSELCICGQVFGNFSNRPEAVETAWKYGFSTPTPSVLPEWVDRWYDSAGGWLTDQACQQGWKTLDRLWLDEIWWRQPIR